ncbi:MAG: Ig-like domain repeat protein [Methanobacteriota archaeon]
MAIDKAGNRNESGHQVLVDRVPPVLAGLFESAVNGTVTTASLGSSSFAWDNSSGLSSASVRLSNASGLFVRYTNASLAGSASFSYSDSLSSPWPNTTYRLNLTATDRAGNVATATVAVADFEVHPSLSLSVPQYVTQSVQRYLGANVTVSLADYGDLAVHELNVSVVRAVDGAVMHSANFTNVTGTVTTSWNATGAVSGAYSFVFRARHGRASTVRDGDVAVPVGTETYPTIEKFLTYGALNGSGDEELYRFVFPSDCGNGFTATVTSLDGGFPGFGLFFGPPEANDPKQTPVGSGETWDPPQSGEPSQTGAMSALVGSQVVTIRVTHMGSGFMAYKLVVHADQGDVLATCPVKDAPNAPGEKRELGG